MIYDVLLVGAGVHVAISYRGEELDERRLISRLHLEIDLLIRNGQIDFYPLTEPQAIRPGVTVLRSLAPGGEALEVASDFVYLATGQSPAARLPVEQQGR